MIPYRHRLVYRVVGGMVWATMLVLGLVAVAHAIGQKPMTPLVNYWFQSETRVGRAAQRHLVRTGDPIFIRRSDSQWHQVGSVESVSVSGQSSDLQSRDVDVTLRWHDRDTSPDNCRLIAYRNRGTMSETLAILFPVEKQAVVRQQIEAAMRQHGDELASSILPLVEQSVRRSLPVIETQLLASLSRHSVEVDALSSRWKDEWVRGRLLPLAKEKILPIAQTHAEPVVRDIGRQLWDRASLWSFTWRAVYDKTPLPRKDLMREEWERFVRDEAIPVIESHADQLAEALQKTLADIAKDPSIRGEVGSALNALVDDAQTRALVSSLLRETLIDNAAVRQVWVEVWTSDEAQAAFQQSSQLIEPLVRQIGAEIVGSPETGITPGFARVLRHQILGKDRSWIVAVEESSNLAVPQQRIERGEGTAIYPLLPVAGDPVVGGEGQTSIHGKNGIGSH